MRRRTTRCTSDATTAALLSFLATCTASPTRAPYVSEEPTSSVATSSISSCFRSRSRSCSCSCCLTTYSPSYYFLRSVKIVGDGAIDGGSDDGCGGGGGGDGVGDDRLTICGRDNNNNDGAGRGSDGSDDDDGNNGHVVVDECVIGADGYGQEKCYNDLHRQYRHRRRCRRRRHRSDVPSESTSRTLPLPLPSPSHASSRWPGTDGRGGVDNRRLLVGSGKKFGGSSSSSLSSLSTPTQPTPPSTILPSREKEEQRVTSNEQIGALQGKRVSGPREWDARGKGDNESATTTTTTMPMSSTATTLTATMTAAATNDNECSLYVAPSTIPGAGLGVYAARPYQHGDLILPSDAPSIAVVDRDAHRRILLAHRRISKRGGEYGGDGIVVDDDDYYDDDEQHPWTHDDYFWHPYAPSATEGRSVSEFVVTIGSLCNYHARLINAEQRGFATYDDSSFVRSDHDGHYGAGAFSYHGGHDFYATRNVHVGEEVFVNYGERWFDTRVGGGGGGGVENGVTSEDETDAVAAVAATAGAFANRVPRASNYIEGEKILAVLREHLAAGVSAMSRTTAAEEEEEAAVEGIGGDSSSPSSTSSSSMLAVIRSVVSVYDPRTAELLPRTAEEFDRYLLAAREEESARRVAIDDDGGGNKDPNTTAEATTATSETWAWSYQHRRSTEWIRSNGVCLDNLVAGKSRIPQAGRGAFARRKVRMGQVVVPAPLLHITDRDELNMYDLDATNNDDDAMNDGDDYDHEGSREWSNQEVVGQQLLLNYCLGHSSSSLLLCPATNAILINHCSNRPRSAAASFAAEYCPDGPNAAYRWSKRDPDTIRWLSMSLDEISNQTGRRGLSMEVYALRDIDEGEEVFVDYGSDWEEAWEEHARTWIPLRSMWVEEEGEEEEDDDDDDDKDNGDGNDADRLRRRNCRHRDHPPPPPPPPSREPTYRYVPVKEMNDRLASGDRSVLRTVRQERDDPYPSNLFLACIYWEDDVGQFRERYHRFARDWSERDWRTLPGRRILDEFGSSGRAFVLTDETERYANYWPCKVYVREVGEKSGARADGGRSGSGLTVRIYQDPTMTPISPWHRAGVPKFLTNYPPESLRFFSRPYQSDQHLRGAFRHHIGIRDELWPELWRDREKNQKNWQ